MRRRLTLRRNVAELLDRYVSSPRAPGLTPPYPFEHPLGTGYVSDLTLVASPATGSMANPNSALGLPATIGHITISATQP
jgi:hypothetical protein